MKRRRLEICCTVILGLLASFTLGFFVGSEQLASAGRTAVTVEAEAKPEPQSIPEEAPEDSQEEPEHAAGAAASGEPLDLNCATLEELETLPGIGPELAQRILDYREAYGPFLTTDQIMEVSGIGEKRYEALKERITVEEQDEDIGSGR